MADAITIILEEYIPYIDVEMKKVIDSRSKVGSLYDMMRYHLGWTDASFMPMKAGGGKQLRSTMCLLACEAISGDFKKALPAAAGLELTHNFTLIHDDIEDGDEKRRHRDTLWKIWGVPQAINTGDAMDVMAYMAIMGSDVKPASMVDILRVFNETIIELCEGQYLDMSFQTRDTVTVEEYVRMVTGKTAALIGASTAIGAMVATGDKDVSERFRLFGREIGIAFQVQDDILGIWGDPKLTGKSARNDIRNKKKTIPVLYAMEVSGDRDELKRIYAKPSLSDADIDRVFDILTKAGALEYTKSMAMKYKNDGMARLDGLCEGSKAMEKLRTVGRFLVERDY